MHEISLVQGLLSQLEELAATHNATHITQVTMLIGPHCGVVTDSFRFGFEVLTKERKLTATAKLVIIEPRARYRCFSCNKLIEAESTDPFQQPEACSCGETLLIPEGGEELILQNVVME